MRKYNEVEQECIPRKVVSTSKKRFSIPLDRKTLACRKKKYRLWKRYLTTKDAKIYEEYCKCRNQVRRMSRKSLISREKNIASKAKYNNKLFWKFVSSKTKMKPSIPDLFTSSNNNPTSMTNVNQVKAELLGNFFSSIFLKEQSWTWDPNGEIKPKITERLSIEITKEDIRKRILKLNTNKSPGPDNIHPRVVKELASIIVDPFYFVFDLSLKTGRVPSAWKLGSICAIYKKKGSRNNV